MRDKIYLCSHLSLDNFMKDFFSDFEVVNLNQNMLNDRNFKNKNVVFVINQEIKYLNNYSFFLNNNVLVFFSKIEKNINEEKYGRTKFFYGPIKIKQFFETVKLFFFSKSTSFKDISIVGEKMTNLNNQISCLLTSLEKNILIELIEHKKIKREYFLEKIMNVKKNIETKTIESHLTRIRKKLLIVKSKIQISSKDDVFYLED